MKKSLLDRLLFLVFMHFFIAVFTQNGYCTGEKDVTIKVHLRGVYSSKISLLGMNNTRLFKPLTEVDGIRDGQTATLVVPAIQLPGEFVLRFDYRESESSTPYPSEKSMIIYRQDIELWVRPQYCNNPDSTWYQPDETENRVFTDFSKENAARKEKIGILQQFLMSYDETESELYRLGVREYEVRRKQFNEWLESRKTADKDLFASSMYPYQYIPEMPWAGSETDRLYSMIRHYFDGMDFKDPLIIRTAFIFKWMDNYVNLYGQLATTTALRDSLFPLAGKTAIDKARSGHPLVYGWMVDYFYRGYETNAIDAGMKILQPYLDDPRCLTSKRLEIERRLKGMETLVPGAPAPPLVIKGENGEEFDLYQFNPPPKFILLLFWSGGCSHCVELADQVYPWQQQTEVAGDIAVVALSLDETETEIADWKKKTVAYPQWMHLRANEGIRSKEAADYFVLATPVMVVIDRMTKSIIATPNSLRELKKAVGR